MLNSLNIKQVINSVQNTYEAQKIIRALEERIKVWQEMDQGRIPEHIKNLAKTNKIAAIMQLHTNNGNTLSAARDAIEEMLGENNE